MTKRIVATDRAPAAIGPYSQAVRVGNFLFCSGQIPIIPEKGELAGPAIAEQTRQVLENLKAVLEAGGASLADVVKTTCFLRSMADYADFNRVYAQYFSATPPSRSCVAVADLPKDSLVEVEAIAHIAA